MRAAVITGLGMPPELHDVAEPGSPARGQALVEVTAAPLNPVDLHIASGRYYAGEPQLPYIAGREGIGTVLEGHHLQPGRRVHFLSRSGYGASGSLAERALIDEATAMEVDEGGASDAMAAAFGIPALTAWLAVAWRAAVRPGDHVLVLAATGAVGQVALQAARLLGATRTVAAGRDPAALRRAEELGATATVKLADDETAEILAYRLRAATDGRLNAVVDPLWGIPGEAAILAASSGARIVNLGGGSSDRATLSSSSIRGGMLTILGLSLFSSPRAEIEAAHRALLHHALAGRLALDLEVVPLAAVARAWRRQAASPHGRLIVDPRAPSAP